MTTTATPTDEHISAVDAFAERLFVAGLAALELLNVDWAAGLGSTSGWRPSVPLPPEQLADGAGISERFAREWLEQPTVAGVMEVDDPSFEPLARRFTLPHAHAHVLLERFAESGTKAANAPM